jgi:hypothetical protein
MVLTNLDAMPTLVEGVSQSPILVVLAGYAAFIPGLVIVHFHNRWTGGWPVVVTVMGWLSLIIGLILMIFPMQLAAIASKLVPACAGSSP